jgi:chaperonin GroES
VLIVLGKSDRVTSTLDSADDTFGVELGLDRRKFLGPSNPKNVIERRLNMKVKPLHDRILIKRVEEKETIKGGIIIPDTAKEKPQEAEVIAVGGGKKTEEGKVIPMDVKAGDRILFGKYSGTEIKVDNEDYLIIREDEVLGIIEAAKQSASGGKK